MTPEPTLSDHIKDFLGTAAATLDTKGIEVSDEGNANVTLTNAGVLWIDVHEDANSLILDNLTVRADATIASAGAFGAYYRVIGGETTAASTGVTYEQLELQIKEHEKRIMELEQRVSELEGEGEVVVLRAISKEQAKREALELFEQSDSLLYSDVARILRIDLEVAVEICEELIAEGEVDESG